LINEMLLLLATLLIDVLEGAPLLPEAVQLFLLGLAVSLVRLAHKSAVVLRLKGAISVVGMNLFFQKVTEIGLVALLLGRTLLLLQLMNLLIVDCNLVPIIVLPRLDEHLSACSTEA
jgi:hypothetical protein